MATQNASRWLTDARRRKIGELFDRYRSNSKAVAGTALIGLLLAVGLLGPLFVSLEQANALNVANRFQPPSPAHPMGTDHLGRDILLRIVLGARISLYIGGLSVGIATAAGVPLGAAAGYVGGNVDDAIMRSMDVLMSFPPILLALTVVAVLGPSLTNAMIAIGITYIPYFARVTRSEVVSVVEEDFVEAARALGERDSRVLFAEVLPNAAAPIIVQASISLAFAILAAAGLSFLGLGAQPPQPSWGLMIRQSKQYLTQAPWMAVFPGLGIATTVLGFNLLGDGIRDVLDPTVSTELGADHDE
ncbi:ABC transporter permease [Halorubrum ezzemoulense]|uniref:ABC transporter permease n=1 Tax=Halorubrum ezzemoulense TaxID=337243 RepID=A0A256J1Q4_HALEZ|nr:ABC transporter permease [Halorubrum ezzemoulense]MDB2224491.1 ABC transporter permease [Halorubrum ezzemoulense]MDB2273868.1 ABC transporter permease [Halorubrum ezzemoulense]MDB9300404.1 ABC transporter permease [Halorubrum ezzemoulense]OYR62738.1 ABC transporter permease [Halorubrum ezzemoulense]OYR77201.1 ABC transporter permease [Halorubrum ezzemoulense]